MVLFGELLDVEGSGTTGAGFEHATSGEHGDDTEHLCGSVKLEDREQIGVVVSEYITSDTDSLLSSSHSLERCLGSRNGIGERNI